MGDGESLTTSQRFELIEGHAAPLRAACRNFYGTALPFALRADKGGYFDHLADGIARDMAHHANAIIDLMEQQ
jgi:hypothetical protein